MSTASDDDSYVEMEAGAAAPPPPPRQAQKPKKPKGPPDHVGEKLYLIELASVLLIGISSYAIHEAAMAGFYDRERTLKEDNGNNDNNNNEKQQGNNNNNKNKGNQVSLFVASLFNANLLNYSLCVALVALILCFTIRCIEKCRPGTIIAPRSFGKFPDRGCTVEKLLAGLNAFWWLIGTCVMTFKGPYVDASNG